MTNSKKQTAVDYYSKEIGRLTSDLVTGKITGKQFVMLEIQLLEQAKVLEKEQHVQIWNDSLEEVLKKLESLKQYYNSNQRRR